MIARRNPVKKTVQLEDPLDLYKEEREKTYQVMRV